MPKKSADIVINSAGANLVVEIAATYATVGAWWLFKKDASAPAYVLLGAGNGAGIETYTIDEVPLKLQGDTLWVTVVAFNVTDADALAGAYVRVFQGGQLLTPTPPGSLKGDTWVPSMDSAQFDFEVHIHAQ